MTELRIWPMQQRETDEAARIFRDVAEASKWPDTDLHTLEEDQAFYRDVVFRENTMFGAYRDGELVGYLAWKEGWISQLFVDPQCQSQGVGTALVERAQSKNDDLRTWAFQSDGPARRFLERHGFVAEEFTDGSENEEHLPDVRYRWQRS